MLYESTEEVMAQEKKIGIKRGRINLGDLKSQIEKKLGPDRAQMYFNCLNRLISRKLNKIEFNRLCLQILGRENIPIHNKFIRSILKNACAARTPPPIAEKNVENQAGSSVKKSNQIRPSASLVRCHAVGLPPLPRKRRTCIRDKKSHLGSNQKADASSGVISLKENGLFSSCDKKSALGLNERVNASSDVISLKENGLSSPCDKKSLLVSNEMADALSDVISLKANGVLSHCDKKSPLGSNEKVDASSYVISLKENGLSSPCDKKSPLGSNEKVDASSGVISLKENGALSSCERKRSAHLRQSKLAERPAKMLRTENSLLQDQTLSHSMKLEESSDLRPTVRPGRIPLQVPFFPDYAGRKERSLLSESTSTCGISNYGNGELSHTEDLRKRVEKVVESQGIGGVTMDLANLLNNSLDTYLKRIIKSAVNLARTRSMNNPTNEKSLNGFQSGNHMRVQNNVVSLNDNEHRNQFLISFQDFKTAMELNPQQLGDNWQSILEKISCRSNKD